MDLLTVVIVLVVVGFALWLINRIPMEATVKTILNIVVIIIVAIWVLKVLGVLAYLSKVTI